jgi:uncharacterized protein
VNAHVLLMAKAPVPGSAKTRLGERVGMDQAATLASAALTDTIEACEAAFGPDRCHLALTGDLGRAVDGAGLQERLAGWRVFPQRGADFAERLANAHRDSSRSPLVQVGMDTPQLTPDLPTEVAESLREADGVLGPAEDGGWWVLGLRDPRRADCLRGVAMSTPSTYADTRAALAVRGVSLATAPTLRDVDTFADAEHVAALAPTTRFATAWRERT